MNGRIMGHTSARARGYRPLTTRGDTGGAQLSSGRPPVSWRPTSTGGTQISKVVATRGPRQYHLVHGVPVITTIGRRTAPALTITALRTAVSQDPRRVAPRTARSLQLPRMAETSHRGHQSRRDGSLRRAR